MKFKYLEGINFKNVEYRDYEKNKNLIFRKDFFKIENSIIYNYDFINICKTLGGKRGIELAKIGIIKWHKINKYKVKKVWSSKICAYRILNLVYNFDFINSISTKQEEDKLKKILKINISFFKKIIFFKKYQSVYLTRI